MRSDSSSSDAKWLEIGRSTSSPREKIQRAEVKVDDYYVVVGFEVNNPNAFKDGTHDLAKDYGHAFFYIVKNRLITKVFSFGPSDVGKIGLFNSGRPFLLKNGMANSRPGDADYAITELVKAFKVEITPQQGRILELETEKARKKVRAGEAKYAAYLNDTCAETARDLLEKARIDTPSGSGAVKHSDIASFPVAYAINPYMWHENFLKDGAREVRYRPPGTADWHPPVGDVDPIFGTKP